MQVTPAARQHNRIDRIFGSRQTVLRPVECRETGATIGQSQADASPKLRSHHLAVERGVCTVAVEEASLQGPFGRHLVFQEWGQFPSAEIGVRWPDGSLESLYCCTFVFLEGARALRLAHGCEQCGCLLRRRSARPSSHHCDTVTQPLIVPPARSRSARAHCNVIWAAWAPVIAKCLMRFASRSPADCLRIQTSACRTLRNSWDTRTRAASAAPSFG